MWWLSLDGQFRLPFNEADCALLSALSPLGTAVAATRSQSVSASLALDPRVLLLAAAGHYGTSGRTPRQLSQLVSWLAVARESQCVQLEPINRRRRKLLREVQKRRERYLLHLRKGSDNWELRRQLERLLKNCGEYPGKWKAGKLLNRWVTDDLLSELADLNPLELVAAIVFPEARQPSEFQTTGEAKTAALTATSIQTAGRVPVEIYSPNQVRQVALSGTEGQPDEEERATTACAPVEVSGLELQSTTEPAAHLNPADYDRLLQTEKLAALRQLAYGASHEINNPLANIAMRAEILLRGESDLDRQRKLQVIRQQAMRAHEMISDLMLFANPPRPNLQQFGLQTWLSQLAEEMQVEVKLAGGELQVEVFPEHLAVGDPVQLAEAVRALIRNGLEAQPCGARICVVAGQDKLGASYLEVSDNGPGISDEIARHMFDPFFSGREAGRGLGFGLPKAWRIAESHGGKLSCLSRFSGATKFRLDWPPLQIPARAA